MSDLELGTDIGGQLKLYPSWLWEGWGYIIVIEIYLSWVMHYWMLLAIMLRQTSMSLAYSTAMDTNKLLGDFAILGKRHDGEMDKEKDMYEI